MLVRLLLPLALASALQAQVVHVDADAPPGGDGSSWAAAYDELADAFAAGVQAKQVWVAEGVYAPTQPLDPSDRRTVTFDLPRMVRLFGGFDGTETSLDQRAGLFSSTVLTGEVGAAGRHDNAYHVLFAAAPGSFAGHVVIDGFTITAGNANGVSPHDSGGAMRLSNRRLTLRNCALSGNSADRGAGLASIGSLGKLLIEGCHFRANRATLRGGGAFLHGRWCMVDSVFERNFAGQRGGGLYVSQTGANNYPGILSESLAQNVLLHDNRAAVGGGAYQHTQYLTASGGASLAHVRWSGCTFAFNAARDGAALGLGDQVPGGAVGILLNSIVWDNESRTERSLSGPAGRYIVSNCDLQDPLPGDAVISVDPGFEDPSARNLRLSPGSPCIDAGNNLLVLYDYADVDRDLDSFESTPFDLDDFPRIRFTVDLGPYERQPD